jgi:hypothetical protein
MRRFAALLIIVGLVAACGGPTATPTSGSSTAEPSQAAPTGPATSEEPTSPATVGPPTEPPATEAPATTEPTSGASVGPSGSISPSVDSLKIQRTADCNSDNGTGTVGYVRITWTASGTTGVRISIDPPSPDKAYGYGYADYPASGHADVPFSCGAPNHDSHGDYHLYVVTTLHDKGYYYWRYAKVYEVVAPSPTP